MWYRLVSDVRRSARFLLAFVASGPSLLFPESCFSTAPLSREWVFTDDRAMVLAATIRVCPLLVILFLLLSEIPRFFRMSQVGPMSHVLD